MSIESDHIIPGNHGKVFQVDFESPQDLERVREALLGIPGVDEVHFDPEIFPHELVIHTHALVHVADVQDCIKKRGFHAIPKTLFGLEARHRKEGS